MDAGRHPLIELVTNAEVVGCTGEPGAFRFRIRKHPRFVREDVCVGYGRCAPACLVVGGNEFDVGLKARKAIYRPLPQSVPAAYVIDPQACLNFLGFERAFQPRFNMRLKPLPSTEYAKRIARLQAELKTAGLDCLVGYSSESEAGTTRYLAGFWPFFDFAGMIIPAEGKAVLITGGPESFEFAKRFSQAPKICIHPLLVETSAPEWVPKVHGKSFKTLLPAACGGTPKRIGVANLNIFPRILFDDLRSAAPKAEFVPADDLLLRVQMIRTMIGAATTTVIWLVRF